MIDLDAPLARFSRWYATVALRCMGVGVATLGTGWLTLDAALAGLGAMLLLASTALALATIPVIGWMEE